MSNSTFYSPLFKGRFTGNALSRWEVICHFLKVWCVPENHPFPDLNDYESRLMVAAMDIFHRKISAVDKTVLSLRDITALPASTRKWFALGEQATLDTDLNIVIREHVKVFPLEDVLPTLSAPRSIAIQLSAEGDVVWAVQETLWAEDDPPVDIYFTLEELGPGYQETISSVSEFALRQLLSYNTVSPKCYETMSMRYTDTDLEALRAWFDYSLQFDPGVGISGPIEIMERENAVAIVINKKHLTISLFCDPKMLELPEILHAQLTQQQE